MLRNKKISVLIVLLAALGCSLPEGVPNSPVIEEQDIENIDSGSGVNDNVNNDTDSGNHGTLISDAGEDGTHTNNEVDSGSNSTIEEVIDAGQEDITCDAGFQVDGGICVTIDPCAEVDCGNGACVSDDNGLSCDCANGYQDNDQNLTCTVSCGTVDCMQYWTCEDFTGTAECVCDEGTQLIEDACEPILCDENEFVSAHECVTCEGGLYNTAGDSAFGSDTTCDADCIEDSHCPTGSECSPNNQCISAGCTSHEQCIAEFSDGEFASPDYACLSDGLCVGLASGKCYIETHCSNDNGAPYCDGDNNNVGDCVACLEHDHCIYGSENEVVNANGFCSNGFCGSLASGACYSDINCSDENSTFCLVGNGLGECKQCITDENCDAIYGGPPGNANFHYECRNYLCTSVVNDNELPDERD